MGDTPNLKLPYIMAAQAQKHVTHNDAIRAFDAIMQLAVLDRDLTTPPGSPGDGDRYIVATGATGAWAGKDSQITAYQDNAWTFYVAQEGWLAWVGDEDQLYVWSGTVWQQVSDSDLQNVPMLGVNTTADATNRLAISSAATLFNHDGAGHQVKINKTSAADTASVLFQTNSSGRAEFGATGDDDWHLKVSPDGTNWNEVLNADKATGNLGIGGPANAAYALRVEGKSFSKETLDGNVLKDKFICDGNFIQVEYNVYSNTNWHGTFFKGVRYRGTLAAPLPVLNADTLIIFDAWGRNTTGISRAGQVVFSCDGVPAAGIVPGMVSFWLIDPAGTSQLAIRGKSDGRVGVAGQLTPATSLDVGGPMKPKTYTVATLPTGEPDGAAVDVSDMAGTAEWARYNAAAGTWKRFSDLVNAS